MSLSLEDVLIEKGLVTQAQIDEALEYQSRHGGKLETHLLRFRYVDEKGLVIALTRVYGCEGVCLSGVSIAAGVLDLIPAEFACDRLVLPVGYHAGQNLLRVACENPNDNELIEAVNEVTDVGEVRLYVAVGVVLKCAIINHYRRGLIQTADRSVDEADESPQEALAAAHSNRHRVLVLTENADDTVRITEKLNREEFEVVNVSSAGECAVACRRKPPDTLIIKARADLGGTLALLDDLQSRRVSIETTPTFLLSNSFTGEQQVSLLRAGVDDVIPLDDNGELFALKLERARSCLLAARRQRLHVIQGLGTHGSLEHINVIDLLQAMGPSEKTARISISGQAKQLTIFLDHGRIVYAECDGTTGVDAVYLGIPWNRGIWSVDPISPTELPEPNIDLHNDLILLEGCRRMDERSRIDIPRPVG
jgi:CheY-like chemotaxis protein